MGSICGRAVSSLRDLLSAGIFVKVSGALAPGSHPSPEALVSLADFKNAVSKRARIQQKVVSQEGPGLVVWSKHQKVSMCCFSSHGMQ